jgi:DNA polymerase epsilon subunit 2
MRFFTKELVFFRDDLVSKMRRHTLLQPREEEEEGDTSVQRQLSRHAVKTVLDQGHLSPLPLSASPICWQHDHALRLYPFPDALIVGDRVEQYYENYEECDAINPGPFAAGFNFVVYRPVGEVKGNVTKSDVEFSQIE